MVRLRGSGRYGTSPGIWLVWYVSGDLVGMVRLRGFGSYGTSPGIWKVWYVSGALVCIVRLRGFGRYLWYASKDLVVTGTYGNHLKVFFLC
jgi:hypothetical protein